MYFILIQYSAPVHLDTHTCIHSCMYLVINEHLFRIAPKNYTIGRQFSCCIIRLDFYVLGGRRQVIGKAFRVVFDA